MQPSKKRKRGGVCAGKPSNFQEAPPPPADTSTTSIASLGDDVLGEILLCLPSIASLARAACACARWRGLASSPAFLRRFRDAHPSLALLGHFVCNANDDYILPVFQPARAHSDSARDAAIRGGDFFLTNLDEKAGWRVQDCRHGRLLFANGNRDDLIVYEPLNRRGVSIRRPRRPRDSSSYFTHCILPGIGDGDDSAASFRVVSVEHNGKKEARAVVYSSRTGAWSCGQWYNNFKNPKRTHEGSYFPAMQAAGRIYWKHRESKHLQTFDAGSMEFSCVPLPDGVYPRSKYAVGETENGACCLVCHRKTPAGSLFEVWRLRKGAACEWPCAWELDRQFPVCAVVDERPRLHHICAVVAGIVLVCTINYSGYNPHVAFRLNSMQVEAKFTSSGWAYPYLMPWPHSAALSSPKS